MFTLLQLTPNFPLGRSATCVNLDEHRVQRPWSLIVLKRYLEILVRLTLHMLWDDILCKPASRVSLLEIDGDYCLSAICGLINKVC
jgi:hypothetical protein